MVRRDQLLRRDEQQPKLARTQARLGRVPLDIDIRLKSDAGTPPAAEDGDEIFAALAAKVVDWLNPKKPASFN